MPTRNSCFITLRRSAGAAICLLGLTSGNAWAGLIIKLSYTIVSTRISPDPKVTRSFKETTLRIDKNIVTNQGDASRHAFGVMESIPEDNGESWLTKRFISNGHLVFIAENESQIIITTIKTDGTSTCTATRKVVLRTGHQNFEAIYDNIKHVYSEKHYEDVVCELSTD